MPLPAPVTIANWLASLINTTPAPGDELIRKAV